MTVAVQIVGGGTTRARTAESRSGALVYAQSRLAALSASPALPAGRSEGRSGDGYTWRLTVAPLFAGPAPTEIGPHLVEIQVTPPDTATGAVALTTILIAAVDPRS